MIDYWLGFSMNILVMLMAFHTYLASKVAQAKDQPFNLMTEKSLFFKRIPSCICQPANYINPMEIYNSQGQIGPNSPKMVQTGPMSPQPVQNSTENVDLRGPQKLNLCGKIIYVLLVLGFNGGFWYFSIKEYLRPASEYINAATELPSAN